MFWFLSISLLVNVLCAVNSMEVSIPQADDFHHHFRDGEVLKDTVRHASRMFRRAVSERTNEH